MDKISFVGLVSACAAERHFCGVGSPCLGRGAQDVTIYCGIPLDATSIENAIGKAERHRKLYGPFFGVQSVNRCDCDCTDGQWSALCEWLESDNVMPPSGLLPTAAPVRTLVQKWSLVRLCTDITLRAPERGVIRIGQWDCTPVPPSPLDDGARFHIGCLRADASVGRGRQSLWVLAPSAEVAVQFAEAVLTACLLSVPEVT